MRWLGLLLLVGCGSTSAAHPIARGGLERGEPEPASDVRVSLDGVMTVTPRDLGSPLPGPSLRWPVEPNDWNVRSTTHDPPMARHELPPMATLEGYSRLAARRCPEVEAPAVTRAGTDPPARADVQIAMTRLVTFVAEHTRDAPHATVVVDLHIAGASGRSREVSVYAREPVRPGVVALVSAAACAVLFEPFDREEFWIRYPVRF